MDDMAAKISGLLQDPETMKQIQALAGMFSANEKPSAPPSIPSVTSATVPSADASVSPELMQTMLRLMPLISGIGRETDDTRFLHALRPLLSKKRQKKLDDASRILQLMQLIPLLKQNGIL